MRRRDLIELSTTAAAGLAVGCASRPAPRRREPRLARLDIRPANERGAADLGWLRARHSFSFSRYYDPAFMSFRGLRVLNEDRIAAGRGFPLHPHRDMEIVTYLLEGALEHRDTLGNGGVIRPGRAQRMSAGSGIRHSEFSASNDETHLLQIWIEPSERGGRASYEDQPLPDFDGRLVPIAARPGREAAVTIHTDASILAARLAAGERAEHTVTQGRGAWIQVARGSLDVNGRSLSAGDGAFTRSDGLLRLSRANGAEVLVFDLG